MKIWGNLREVVSLIFRKDSKDIRIEPATQSGSGPVVLTIPDIGSNAANLVTTAVTGDVTVSTLGVTSISAGVIVDADIKSDAAIAVSKLANLGAGKVLLGNGTGIPTATTLTGDITISGSGVTSIEPGVILNADINASANIQDTKLGTISTAGKVANSATTAASGNSNNTIVARDGSGNFSAGTITATLKGTAYSTAASTGALTLPSGSSAEQPAPVDSVNGMVRYNTTSNSFEGYAASVWSPIGGGGTTDRVTQASHGFVVGDTLYLNGATYTKAIATSAAAAEVVGVVSRVIDASTFELTLSGEVSGLSGLTVGEVYFLSAATAGALTMTEPSVIGQVSVPVGVASSTTTLYVAPKRGAIVGGANARTQISLANNATTTVQNASTYDAGELAGWVYIDATTDYRFYVQAQFAKNGAGTDYNLAYQTTGDTPPAGFSMSITSGGNIQITLPSLAGYASANINFALNAPAVGTAYPLNVDSGNVSFGTIKAKDGTGLVFQEDGGTTTGTVSDAGAWTLGTSGYTGMHVVNGSFTVGQSLRATGGGSGSFSGSGVEIDYGAVASNVGRILSYDRTGSARRDLVIDALGLSFYANNGTSAGGYNSSYAWTFGTSSGLATSGVYHIMNGPTAAGSIALQVVKKTGADSSSNYYMEFYAGTGSTIQGGLWNNAAGDFATYTSSDARIKTDVRDAEYGLQEIMQLKPRSFTKEGIEDVKGFIAQEVKEVLPESVGFRKTEEYDDFHILEMQTMIPVMVKAIQELKEQLDEAKAKIAALEAK